MNLVIQPVSQLDLENEKALLDWCVFWSFFTWVAHKRRQINEMMLWPAKRKSRDFQQCRSSNCYKGSTTLIRYQTSVIIIHQFSLAIVHKRHVFFCNWESWRMCRSNERLGIVPLHCLHIGVRQEFNHLPSGKPTRLAGKSLIFTGKLYIKMVDFPSLCWEIRVPTSVNKRGWSGHPATKFWLISP